MVPIALGLGEGVDAHLIKPLRAPLALVVFVSAISHGRAARFG
jgi:hypothetical protein